jgi:hypothetical protein
VHGSSSVERSTSLHANAEDGLRKVAITISPQPYKSLEINGSPDNLAEYREPRLVHFYLISISA